MASHNYSNGTLFGIRSDGERYAYAGWYLLVIIASLLGDTTILISTIKYNAINLNKATVTFIQHIAVADLGFATTYLLSMFVSTIARRQVYGEVVCISIPYCGYYFVTSGALSISGMTLTKLLRLKFPLKSRTRWYGEHARKICAGIWLSALYYPVALFIVDKSDVYFDYRLYNCMYGYSSPKWKWLQPIISIIIPVIPNLVIVSTTILMLLEARKAVRLSHKHLRWQGILTAMLTAIVFTLAFLPYAIYFISEQFVAKNPSSPVKDLFYSQFYRVAIACTAINTMSNFFIYSLTVKSFRGFLCTRFYLVVSYFSTTTSQTGRPTQNIADIPCEDVSPAVIFPIEINAAEVNGHAEE